ncbi:BQ2448_6081 [Microbotryum intermedium]|uniref:BQ2448_6081 protein n=1 Tax=Microbotryum intermedium TaxID=269621 RepID=A0A238FNA7_9BASI|nr:BQ2448_6081 [Microbotryum intermedium]
MITQTARLCARNGTVSHIISRNGIAPDQSKVDRIFINGLAQHTKPLSNLTLKNANVRLMWGVEQERHFKAIKALAITSLPSCLKPIHHTDCAEPLVRYG